MRLAPRGPFSLAAAGRFLGEFPPADNVGVDRDGSVRLAFVLDDFSGTATVVLRQAEEDGPVEAEVAGTERLDVARAQLQRILGLEHDGGAFLPVLYADSVLRAAWEQTGRLRPVAFPSPYEAACWAVISLRLRQPQGVAVRRRIEAELGEDGIFPVPQRLLDLDAVDGLSDVKSQRLRAVAQAALDGRLDPLALRALPQEQALAQLREIPGLGPFYATLVLVRATGTTDAFVPIEALRKAAAHAYDLAAVPGEEELLARAEGWRPFRAWAGVLLRASRAPRPSSPAA